MKVKSRMMVPDLGGDVLAELDGHGVIDSAWISCLASQPPYADVVDVVDVDRGVVLCDLLRGESGSESVEDYGDENASTSDAGLAVADGGIGGEAFQELS